MFKLLLKLGKLAAMVKDTEEWLNTLPDIYAAAAKTATDNSPVGKAISESSNRFRDIQAAWRALR